MGRKFRFPRSERRSAKDFLAVAGISAVAAVAVVGAVVTADSGEVSHTVATEPVHAPAQSSAQASAQQLQGVREVWRSPNETPQLNAQRGGVLLQDGSHHVTMKEVATGREVWEYTAADPICGAEMNWSQTILVMRSNKGCGEVVSLQTSTGQYSNTRAGLASQDVAVQRSNDHVGTISDRRVELWRNDLVRTVEVGHVEVPTQPGKQKHAGCAIGSALWRTELLAVIQNCADNSVVRLMKATPEEASEPEDHGEWELPRGSTLVAIGQDRAVAYVPASAGGAPEFRIFHEDGKTVDTAPAAASDLLESQNSDGFSAATADLPHQMTWWDGQRLVAFNPATMLPEWTIDNAIGTGAAMGERALIPVAEGIAVVNWNDGHVDRVVPVDRSGYAGPVTLTVSGTFIIEQRGGETVAMEAQF